MLQQVDEFFFLKKIRNYHREKNRTDKTPCIYIYIYIYNLTSHMKSEKRGGVMVAM
jgi:hypothetical protein